MSWMAPPEADRPRTRDVIFCLRGDKKTWPRETRL